MNMTGSTALTAEACGPLHGSIQLPGDKSISHRALILSSMAIGESCITGLLEGADVLSTAAALRQLGVRLDRHQTAEGPLWQVAGVGLAGFAEPDAPLDLGNAGTGARLLMGAVAGAGITAVFTGDASLSQRPMDRITKPLTQMGATAMARQNRFLPLTLSGTLQPMSIDWQSKAASAQVKSAILLAGLTARGETRVTEPVPSRDHTETMLRHFGVELATEMLDDGRYSAALCGGQDLHAADISVPVDPSSAAFPAVAALICEGSAITLDGVCLNPLRFGLFQTLQEMGADIRISNRRMTGGEPVGDLEIRHSSLRGIRVPPARAASMIDEYPILAVAAAFASGETVMEGIGELRIKETDRIQAMADGLTAAGVRVETSQDSMTVHGTPAAGGMTIDACHDHRIAMSFLVLGLACDKPVTVTGTETIATSFPGFAEIMTRLGARMGNPPA